MAPERKATLYSEAAVRGDVEMVTLLLHAGVNVRRQKNLALRVAAQGGHIDVFKLLLAHGARVNANEGEPLYWAAWSGLLELVDVLLNAGCDVNINEGSALDVACARRHAHVVNTLLEAGANVQNVGRKAFENAAKRGYNGIIRILLVGGIVVPEEIIFKAAGKGQAETLALIFDDKDSIVENGEGSFLERALKKATKANYVDVVKVLLDACRFKSVIMGDALCVAARRGTRRIDEALLSATTNSHYEIVVLLLQAGDNIIHSGPIVTTSPTYIKRAFNSIAGTDVVDPQQQLRQYIEARDRALIIAASSGHVDIVKSLLEASADVHANDEEPLYQAAMGGHYDVVDELVQAGGGTKNSNVPCKAISADTGSVELRGAICGGGSAGTGL
ncbi:hypothetical protein HDV00_007468 [Rhizophlyctis rosea]|nr:hypothetical protein HDV00_007468 [Rhizophlyctis rosea]